MHTEMHAGSSRADAAGDAEPTLEIASTPVLDVSVVLPCLDEEASVGLCVQEAHQALTDAGLRGEVIVVDNGSTDRSAEVATDAGARVITERRAGYGNALRAGIRVARGTVVVMADADCTYELSRVGDLVRPVLDGDTDMMVGGRLDEATTATMPFLHRMVGTPALTFLNARACGGLTIRDSQSGYRAFRRDAALRLGLTGTGMEFASELLIRAARDGWRIREIPTTYRQRVGESKLNTLQDGWRHLRLILLLAPDLLLIWPGLALASLGMLFAGWGLASGDRLHLGSWHWQPVFFSSVTIVLGIEALFAGIVLANRSAIVSPSVRRRFDFVEHRRFSKHCLRAGAITAVVGLVLDVALASTRAGLTHPSDRALVLAGLAQTMVIIGATIAGFGGMTQLVLDRRRGDRLHAPAHDGGFDVGNSDDARRDETAVLVST